MSKGKPFIRHIVNEMDESLVQRCVICGEIISDYRHAMKPIGSPPPKGISSGEVFVRDGCYLIALGDGYDFVNCNGR